MKFDIYQSDVLEKASNTIYKNHIEVTDETSLKKLFLRILCVLYIKIIIAQTTIT